MYQSSFPVLPIPQSTSIDDCAALCEPVFSSSFFLSKRTGLISNAQIEVAAEAARECLVEKGKVVRDAPVNWWDIENLTEEDAISIKGLLNISKLTAKDLLRKKIREKWESYQNYLFLVVHEAVYDNSGEVRFYPMKILVFENLLVTIHPRRIPGARTIIQKFSQDLSSLPSSGWCLSALLHAAAKEFQKLVTLSSVEVNSIDSLIAEHDEMTQNATPLLSRFRASNIVTSKLFYMIAEKETCTETLCRGNRKFLISHVQIYLRSLLHRYANMRTSLQVQLEILSNAQHNFLTATSARHTREDLQSSEVIKKLTSAGTIFMPGVLLAGAFSMNVQVPEQLSGSLVPFGVFVACIVILAFITYLYYRRINFL